MIVRLSSSLALLVLTIALGAQVSAQVPNAAAPASGATGASYKLPTGNHGERLAASYLEAKGFEVLPGQTSGGQGIDLVAIKRGPDGRVVDLRFVEVKTRYGGASATSRLKTTKFGKQLSREWIGRKLWELRNDGPAGRRLVRQIRDAFKDLGDQAFVSRSLLIDVDLDRRLITEFGPGGVVNSRAPLRPPVAGVRRTYKSARAAGRGRMSALNAASRNARSIMSVRRRYVPMNRAHAATGLNKLRSAANRNATATGRFASLKSAAKLGVKVGAGVGTVMTAVDVGYQLYQWDQSVISTRTLTVVGAGGSGSLLGGALAGAALGAAGLNPVTVVIGAAVGAFAGHTAGSLAAKSWYDRMDRDDVQSLNLQLATLPSRYIVDP
jgi:Holliday junction resolvase-like predicted endonuclease